MSHDDSPNARRSSAPYEPSQGRATHSAPQGAGHVSPVDYETRRAQWQRDLDHYKRDINLVQFAIDHGFVLKREKSTRRAKVLKHPNGDRILVARNARDDHWVYHSLGGDEHDSGTIVDFLRHRDARDMRAVHETCRVYLGQPRTELFEHRVEAGDLTFQRDLVIARYLQAQTTHNSRYMNERGIRPETLCSPRFQDTWRVDVRGNVLFPHRDDEGLCGYEVKNRGYTSFAKQSRKTVWRSRAFAEDDRIVITESAVEAFSYYQLHKPDTSRFMSVGGAWSPAAVDQVVKSSDRLPDNGRVVLAFNADAGGRELADRLQPEIEKTGRAVTRHFPAREGADWNDLLKIRERAYIATLHPKKARAPEQNIELER